MLKTKNVEGHPRKTQITSVMFEMILGVPYLVELTALLPYSINNQSLNPRPLGLLLNHDGHSPNHPY